MPVGRSRKGVRRALSLAAVAATALVAVASAHAAGGHPDPRFGAGGILRLSRGQVLTGAAILADGDVALVTKSAISFLGPSGSLDLADGEAGHLPFVGPGGAGTAEGVVVDPAGRLWAFGDSAEDGRPRPGVPVEPVLDRYTEAGMPDPALGAGTGFLAGTFGLPPAPSGAPAEAAIEAVAFDSAGRLYLTGEMAVGTSEMKPGVIGTIGEEFLVRLAASGEVDPGFASGGVLLFPERTEVPVAVGPAGRVVVPMVGDGREPLVRLGEDGRPESGFGAGGAGPQAIDFGPPVVDGDERVIGLSTRVRRKATEELRIHRLDADGLPDPTFGRAGLVTLRRRGLEEPLLRLDEEGRVLIAGLEVRRRGGGEADELVVMRLRPDGSIDRSFGRNGVAHVPLPGTAELTDPVFDVRDGRALISGEDCVKERCRSVLAMVDLGR